GGLLASCHTAPPRQPAPQPAPAPAPAPGPVTQRPGVPTGQPVTPQDTTQRPALPQPGADPVPRPYNRVITAEAKTKAGLFKTHRIGSRLYYEIPKSALNKEMLLVTRTARVPVNQGYGGLQAAPNLVLKWERRDNRVLLRTVSYETVADSASP